VNSVGLSPIQVLFPVARRNTPSDPLLLISGWNSDLQNYSGVTSSVLSVAR
jgi:hypothetical protein